MACDALSSLVSSSPYAVYYRAAGANGFVNLGVTKAEDGVVERIKKGEQPIQSVALGEATTINTIYTGQDRFLEMTLQEFNRDAVQDLLFDYTAVPSGTFGSVSSGRRGDQFWLGAPGMLSSSYGGSLKLAPIYNAAPSRRPNIREGAQTRRVLHYYCVALANDEELAFDMRAGLLEVAVVVRLFPNLNAQRGYVFGEWTNSI